MLQSTLAAIFRYPVKSMAGESLSLGEITPHGLARDRLYAFESPNAPPGMLRVSSAERRHLLRYRASATSVLTPHGQTLHIDSPELLTHLRLHLNSPALALTRASVPQTDCRPVSLISLQTVQQISCEIGAPVDLRRFRANLILDRPNAPGFHEDALVGQTACLGSGVVLRILERDPRCRFITFDPAAPASPADTALINHLHRYHQPRAGIYAAVVTPGVIGIGDTVTSNEKAPGIPEA